MSLHHPLHLQVLPTLVVLLAVTAGPVRHAEGRTEAEDKPPSPKTPQTDPGRLTPKTLTHHPLRFKVEVERPASGKEYRVRFQAARGAQPLSTTVSGLLEIVDGETRIAACRIREQRGDEDVTYEFHLAEKYLVRSRFTFVDLGRGPLKLGDKPSGIQLYWFHIGDFLGAQPAVEER